MAAQTLDLRDIKGVGPETARKLANAGFNSVEYIAATPVRELMDKVGLGFETAHKISEAARMMVNQECVVALDIYRRRLEAQRLTTGSTALDRLLGGGIETQAITEFVGEFSSGKSQLCMKLSVTCQLPREKGGLEGKAYFIDTEGTFSPERIYEIAQNMGLEPEKVLSNILYSRAYNSDHQILLVDKAASFIPKENVKLLVVDSVISHFRSEYVGRENLSERQQKLNLHIHKLLRLAEVFNLAVVVTNQIQANPQTFFGDPNKPAGGNILAHACTHRILLRRSKLNLRIARVLDSPKLPEASAMFQINSKGIDDVNEKDSKVDVEE